MNVETTTTVPPPPKRKAVEEVTLTFVRDGFGALRCNAHRTTGFVPKSVKPKVVLFSELEAWRVTAAMTAKEKQNRTHNSAVPLAPVQCASGFNHWHLGHSRENVGRKPSRVLRLQLLAERLDAWFTKFGK